MLNQKDGVFKCICLVLDCDKFDSKVELTTEQRKRVTEMVSEGIHSGEIGMKEKSRQKYDTVEKLMTEYVPGLVSNHLRKDKRLNGGVDYEIKNPGSRSGNTDPVVRELRKLLKRVTSEEDKRSIQIEIDKKLESIQDERNKSIEVKVELIPEELKHLVK